MYPPAARSVAALTVTVGETTVDTATGVVGSAVGAALGTLVVGAILLALFEGRTDRATATVAEAPVGCLGSGLVLLVGLVVLVLLLVVSILGLVFVIPVVLVAYLVWAAGSAVALLAVAERLVGTERGRFRALVLAAVLSGGLTLTGVGGVLSFVAGAVGVGALWRTR